MPTHAEKCVLPYTQAQVFDLVADIEKYPQFLPWCASVSIRKREGNVVTADMEIGFKFFREKFTSIVTLEKPGRIDVMYSEGPFKYLNNHWTFTKTTEGYCEISFFVDFEFRSRLLQGLIGSVFDEAVRIMVSAFRKRARELYG